MGYDMALSNLLIQITRNRMFTPLWIEILKIVFERAKDDKEYAAIIGGIFDGSLPSYKALTPKFILKSFLQGGMHFGLNTASGILRGPAHWIKKGKSLKFLQAKLLEVLKKAPGIMVNGLPELQERDWKLEGT